MAVTLASDDNHKYGTPFIESEALFATEADDDQQVRNLLFQLTSRELKVLARTARQLADSCDRVGQI